MTNRNLVALRHYELIPQVLVNAWKESQEEDPIVTAKFWLRVQTILLAIGFLTMFLAILTVAWYKPTRADDLSFLTFVVGFAAVVANLCLPFHSFFGNDLEKLMEYFHCTLSELCGMPFGELQQKANQIVANKESWLENNTRYLISQGQAEKVASAQQEFRELLELCERFRFQCDRAPVLTGGTQIVLEKVPN